MFLGMVHEIYTRPGSPQNSSSNIAQGFEKLAEFVRADFGQTASEIVLPLHRLVRMKQPACLRDKPCENRERPGGNYAIRPPLALMVMT